MNTKSVLSAIFIVLLVFTVLPTLEAQQGDFVVLLDVSESVFPIFDDLVNYLIRDALLYQVEPGDTVHLMKFNSLTELVMDRNIAAGEDVEEVIKTVMLLHPLGRYTDLIGAFQELYNYTRGLPTGREKTILILTDGIHDPPPGSANQMSSEEAREKIRSLGEEIRRQGWDVHLVQLPGEAASAAPTEEETEEGAESGTGAGSPGENIIGEFTEPLDIDAADYSSLEDADISRAAFGSPAVEFPDHLGRVGPRFRIPLSVKNFSRDPLLLRLVRVEYEGENILVKPVSAVIDSEGEDVLKPRVRVPESFTSGEQEITVTLVFDENIKPIPNSGTVAFTLKKASRGERQLNMSVVWLFLVILIIIAVVLLLFFVIRRLLARSSTAAGSQARVKYEEKVLSDKEGFKPIELFVAGQNHQIGLRNVHILRPGQSRSVGGRGSQFLIFLVDFPRHIGELQFDGKSYTFMPIKGDYFAGSGKPVKNCLEKTITAVSATGYRVEFRFREYISALERINRIMHLTDKPGVL